MDKRAKHKSLSKEMKPLMRKLETSFLVTRVVIGISENARHRMTPGKAKLQATTEAGFRLKLYTGNGVTDMFVCCTPINRHAVLRLIHDFLV